MDVLKEGKEKAKQEKICVSLLDFFFFMREKKFNSPKNENPASTTTMAETEHLVESSNKSSNSSRREEQPKLLRPANIYIYIYVYTCTQYRWITCANEYRYFFRWCRGARRS